MRERLRFPTKMALEEEARHLMEYAGLTEEQAWAKIASYALAKQAEAAAKEGIHYGPARK